MKAYTGLPDTAPLRLYWLRLFLMQGPKVNICMRLQLILVVHIYRMVLDYMQTQRLILVSLVEWVVLAVQIFQIQPCKLRSTSARPESNNKTNIIAKLF